MANPIANDFTAIAKRLRELAKQELAKPGTEQDEAGCGMLPEIVHRQPGPVPVKRGKRYTWTPTEGWVEHDARHSAL